MNPEALAEAMRPYLLAQEQLEDTREQAYNAIREAAKDGMSLRAIADVVGMSHQRVSQVLGRQVR